MNPVEFEEWPVLVTDEPVEVEEWPVVVTDGPVEFEKWPVLVTDEPVEFEEWPVLVMDEPVAFQKWPILVTDEPVEFEEWPVEVQDLGKTINHFRGIYVIYPTSIKKNRKMSTYMWPVGLGNTLGSLSNYAQKFSSGTVPWPLWLTYVVFLGAHLAWRGKDPCYFVPHWHGPRTSFMSIMVEATDEDQLATIEQFGSYMLTHDNSITQYFSQWF
jgi:hypothetical protein